MTAQRTWIGAIYLSVLTPFHAVHQADLTPQLAGGRRERLLINNKLDWYLHVSPVTNTAGGGGGDGQTGQTGAARIRTLTFSINSIFVWSPQEGEGDRVVEGGRGGEGAVW